MKRKSMIAMVMAAAMVIGLTACGNSGESSENAAPESEAAPSSQEQQEESEDSSTGAVNTTAGLIWDWKKGKAIDFLPRTVSMIREMIWMN